MTRRLLASYLALTLVLLIAIEVPSAIAYADRARTEVLSDLQRDAFAISGYVEETLEGLADEDLQALVDAYADRTDARVVIVDVDGVVLADSAGDPGRDFSSREEISAALQGQVAVGERRSETLGTGLVYATVPIASGEVLGAVRVTYSTDQLDERVRRYWLTLLGVAVVSLAAAAGVGVAFARWVGRPLDRVRLAAVALGSGDLAARAPEDQGPPEVRQLARSFNATAGRLEHLVTAQEAFVADASHQLRTPLTALRLRLEVLAGDVADAVAATGRPEGDESVHDDVDAALEEVARLSRLVDGLLALARAERQEPGATARPLVAGDVLAERADAWEPLAAEHGVTLVVEPSPVRLRATPDRITQVVDNLVANAVEASPSGTSVVLRAEPVPGGVEVHVTDEGPGLTDEQRDRAFDRFWRAGEGRTGLGGSGLGLPIVARLAAADGGRAELRAAPGGGLDAVVRYPGGASSDDPDAGQVTTIFTP